jgi:gliding motility-associated-like protein
MLKLLTNKLLVWIAFVITQAFSPHTYIACQVSPAIYSSPQAVNKTIQVCQGNASVVFGDSVHLGGFHQTWTFQNGTPANAIGPGPHNVNFSDTGKVYITLLDSLTGLTSIDSVTVNVNTLQPSLSFTPLTNNGGQLPSSNANGVTYYRVCGPATGSMPVRLANNSVNVESGTTYTIDWGNGNIQTTHNGQPLTHANWPNPNTIPFGIQHNYTSQNLYVITVSATNPNGCTSTTTINYFWGSTPAGSIVNPGNAAVCLPDVISFPVANTSTNVPGTSYTFTVNDGSPSITYLHPNVPSNFSHQFLSPSCNVGSGNNINQFTIEMVVSNPCDTIPSTALAYVSTKNNPGFTVNPDTVICINKTITLTDTTVYGINATSPLCDTLTARYWSIEPAANILSGFQGDTLGVSGQPNLWFSGTKIVSLSFSQPGNYAVKLFHGNACLFSDSVVKNICVLPLNQANFSMQDTVVCAPETVAITNTSTPAPCGQNNYLWQISHSDTLACGNNSWSFVNGTDSLSRDPSILFNGAGIYDITLLLNPQKSPADTNRCPVDTIIKKIYVASGPVIDSITGNTQICLSSPAQLIGHYTACYDTDSLLMQWTSSFSTPNSASIDTLNALFSNFGNYYSSFTVSNSCGVVSDSVLVQIFEPALVNAGNDTTLCEGSSVLLNGSIGGSAQSGTWSSNGVISPTFNPNTNALNATYIPSANASAQVYLILTSNDPQGPCPAVSDSLLITYDDKATVNITIPSSSCIDTPIPISASLGGLASSGQWTASVAGSFTPGNTSLNATFTPQPGFTGAITFKFVTNDPPGTCSADSAIDITVVHPLPQLTISPPNHTICNAQSFQSILSSNLPGTTFSWTINNVSAIQGATQGTGNILTDTLLNPGIGIDSVVYLITPTANNCPGPPQSLTVYVNPVATILIPNDTTVCQDEWVGPFSFSTVPQNTSWQWSSSNPIFNLTGGNSSISAFQAPPNSGTTSISTTILLQPTFNLCPGQPDSFQVIVLPKPGANALPPSEIICSGTSTTTFTNSSQIPGSLFTWGLHSSGISSSGVLAGPGTSSIPSHTLVNNSANTDTVTYWYIFSANGCLSDTAFHSIIIPPLPNITLSPDQTVCSAGLTAGITANSNVNGTTFAWSTTSSSPNLSAFPPSGTGDSIPPFSPTNSGTQTETLTITFTPTAAGCAGTPQSHIVTVLPNPTVILTPPTQTLCDNAISQPILFSSTSSPVSYNWSLTNNPAVTGINPTSGTGDSIPAMTLNNSGNTTQTATFTITPEVGPNSNGAMCPGTPANASITIQPTPDVIATPNPATICSGQNTNIALTSSVSGTTFTFNPASNPAINGATSGTGNTIADILAHTNTSTEVQAYTVTPSANNCPGSPLTVTVNVLPLPIVDPILNVTLCPNDNHTQPPFNANIQGVSFAWTNSNTAIGLPASGNGNIPNFTAAANNTNAPVSATITVSPTLNGCAGPDLTFTISVNPTPTITTSPLNQTVCEGNPSIPVVLTSNVSATQFTWNSSTSSGLNTGGVIANGNGNLPAQTFFTSGTTQGSINYIVTPSAANCAGNPVTYTYFVNPAPSITLSPDQTVCSAGLTAGITANSNVNGTTFAWSTTSSSPNLSAFPPSGTGDSIPPFSPTNSGTQTETLTITFTPTAAGCAGTPQSHIVTVLPNPTVILTPPTQTLCDNAISQPILFSSTSSPVSYNWSLTNNPAVTGINPTSGTGDSIPAMTLNNSGNTTQTATFTITPEVGPNSNGAMCPGTPANASITIQPTPDVIATPNPATICSGQNTNIALTSSVSGTTFTFNPASNPAINGATSGTGNTIADILAHTNTSTEVQAYTVTPSANNCPGSPLTVTVNVLPLPIVDPILNVTLCPNDNHTQPPFNANIQGVSFAWTNSNTAIGLPASGNGNIPNFTAAANNTNAPVSATITVSPTLNGCAGPDLTFTISVNPTPTITTSPLNQTVCEGNPSIPVVLTSNVSATQFTWNSSTSSGLNTGGVIANGNGNLPAQTFFTSGTTQGSINYIVTPSAANCAGNPVTYTYFVNPAPSITLSPDQTVCSAGLTAGITANSNVNGTTFAWSTTSSSPNLSAFPPSGTGDSIPPFSPTNSGTQTETLTITFTPTAAGCAGTPQSHIVTVLTNPTVILTPPSQTLCDNAISQPILFSSTSSPVSYNWSLTNNPAVTGINPTSGTGDSIPAMTLNNSGNTTQTATFTITPEVGPNSNGAMCPGTPANASITIQPTPDVIATPNPATICSGQNTNIALTSSVSGTTFTFNPASNPAINGATSGTGNTIADILAHTNTSTEVQAYTVTPSANNCPGSPLTVTVNVLPLPIVDPILNVTLCPNDNHTQPPFNANIQGVSFAWTNSNTAIGLPASGNGNIPNFTAAANNTNAPVSATITVSPTLNGCAGPDLTFTISVNPTPTITTSPLNQTVCEGNPSIPVVLTSNVSATQFTWNSSTSSGLNTGGVIANGNGNLPAQTFFTSGTTQGSINYIVTPSAANCAGNPVTYTYFVNPAPSITLSPDQTVCSAGLTAGITANSNVNGTTFAWSTTSSSPNLSAFPPSGTGDSIPPFSPTNSGTQTETLTITFTPTAAGCAGTPQSHIVTVLTNPTVILTPPSQTLCDNAISQPILFSSTSSPVSYNWSLTNNPAVTGINPTSGTGDSIPAMTLNNSGNTTQTATFTITPEVGPNSNGAMCPGTPANASITIQPTPDVIATPNPATICSGQNTNIALTSSVSGTTFTFNPASNPAINGATSGTGNTIADILAHTNTSTEVQAYTVTPSANNCPGSPLTVTVNVLPLPIIDPILNVTLCPNDNHTQPPFNANIQGVSFAWTNSNTAIGLPASGNGNIPNFTAAANNTNAPVSATITVSPTLNGCAGPDLTFTISVNPTPTITTSPLNQTVCEGNPSIPVVLTSNVSATQFTWNSSTSSGLNTGGVIANGNGNLPAQTFFTSGTTQGSINYIVTPSAANCAGNPVTYTYFVNPAPSITLSPDQTVCSAGLTAGITANSNVNGTTFSWSTTSSSPNLSAFPPSGTGDSIPPFSPTNSGTQTETLTITFTPTAAGCAGTPQSHIVTVLTNPTVILTPPSQTLCDNAISQPILFSSTSSPVSYNWSLTNNPAVTGINPTSGTGDSIPAMTLNNSGNTTQTATFTITPEVGPNSNGAMCPGTPANASITIQPTPDVIATPNPATICSGQNTNIALTSSVSGTTFTFNPASNPAINGATSGTGNTIADILAHTNTSTEVQAYTVTPSANNCPGSPLTVTVNVLPLPIIDPILNVTLCPNDNHTQPPFNANIQGVSFAWTNSNTAIGLPASGNGNIPNFTAAANNTNAPVSATITVSPTLNGCAGPDLTFTISVNPTPTITTSPLNQTVCEGNPSIPVVLTSNVSATQFTWNSSTSSGLNTGGVIANGNGNLPAQTFFTSGTTQGSINYIVTPSAANCAGNPVTYTYFVNPAPSITLSPDQTVCSAGLTAGITANSNVNGTTFSWSTTSSSPNLSAFPPSGTGDSIPPFSPTNSGTQTETLTITFTPTAAGCAGTPQSHIVTVLTNPTVILTPPSQTLCDNAISQPILFSSTSSPVSYNWSLTNNPAVTGINPTSGTGDSIPAMTLNNSGNTTQTATFTITPEVGPNSNGAMCPGTPANASITIQPTPDVIATPNPATICSGQNTNIALTSSVSGTTFTFNPASNPAINGATSGTGNIINDLLTHSNPIIETQQYVITPMANNCPGPALTVDVQILPLPVMQSVPGIQVCPGDSISPVVFIANPGPASFSWTNSNPSNGLPPAGTGNIGSHTAPFNQSGQAIAGTITVTPNLNGCSGAAQSFQVVINPQPVITLSPLQQTVCSGSPSQLIIPSSNVIGATFTWQLTSSSGISGSPLQSGTGNLLSQVFNTLPLQQGSVIYTLQAAAAGCASQLQNYLYTVTPLPDMSVIPAQSVCSGGTTNPVTFTSGLNSTQFQWVSTASSPLVTNFPSNGNSLIPVFGPQNGSITTESIQFTITPQYNGCSGPSATHTVTVYPVVTVSASPGGQTLCENNLSQQIIINGSQPGVVSQWNLIQGNFINGLVSGGLGDTIPGMLLNNSTSIPQIAYYQIQPSYNSCPGVSDTVSITVFPTPIAFASPNPDTICSGTTTAILLNSNTPGTLFSWTANNPNGVNGASSGSGTIISQQLSHNSSSNQAITYNVIPIANNCTGPNLAIPVTVYPQPQIVSLHDSLVCRNTSVPFSASSSIPGQFNWNFGDGNLSSGQASQHTYLQTGLFQTQLTVISALGCSTSVIQPIRVIDVPQANFSVLPASGCAPLVVNLNNLSQGHNMTYNWFYGNGSFGVNPHPSLQVYPGSAFQDTTYLVQLTVSNLCGTSTHIDSVTVFPLPTAFFGTNVSSGCSPLSVQMSQNSFGLPTSYSWDFGNGTTSNQALPPTVIYSNATQNNLTFPITLTVSNACGSSQHTDSIQVAPNTVTAFFNTNPTSGCAPLNVQFTNFSMGATQYVWDLGDGTTTGSTSTSHIYTQPGIYTVQLAANNGCSFDTTSAQITVHPGVQGQIIAQFDSICPGIPIQFGYTGNNIAGGFWDFGNGQTSQLSSPSSAYNQPGIYTVSLILTSQVSACTDTLFKHILIHPSPVPILTLSDTIGCQPFNINVSGSGSDLNFFTWDFGDGSIKVGNPQSHQYTQPGTFTLTLIGESVKGCKDSLSKAITVFPQPIADFLLPGNANCSLPAVISIQNTSVNATAFEWNFGNGQNGFQANPTIQYNSMGLYEIRLIANNQYGCSDTTFKYYQVYDSPLIAAFSMQFENNCLPFKVDFINESIGATQFTWHFGDGFGSTSESPVYVYNQAGSYLPYLIVTNQLGCTDTVFANQSIQAFPVPDAGFSIQPAVIPQNQPLFNITDQSNGGILVYYSFSNGDTWFQQGGYTTMASPDTGLIEVIQYVVNEFGCIDSAYGTIRVIGASTFYVPNSFTPNGDGVNETFRAYGLNIYNYRLEIFNRWGEKIFETEDLFDAWDGTYMNVGGNKLQTGVYPWRITYSDIHGERHNLRGHVNLIDNGVED